MATMSAAVIGVTRDRRDAYDEIVLVMHAPVRDDRRTKVRHEEDAFVLEAVVGRDTSALPPAVR
jgi:hypothetical protein